MSGIFIKRTDGAAGDAASAARRLKFTEWTSATTGVSAGFSYALTWIGPDDFFPHYRNGALKVTICMAGRIYDSHEDVRIDRKFGDIAIEYREKGFSSLTGINGAGALILFDEIDNCCFIVTDRFLSYHLFMALPKVCDSPIVCSHADVLAAACPRSPEYDLTSMASVMTFGSSVHPYTLYQDIHALDAGAIYRWNQDGLTRIEKYWTAEPNIEPYKSLEDYGEETAYAIKRAVNMRLRNAGGKSGVFLSGGLDSRSILFAAEKPRVNLVGITFCDTENYETNIAKKLAEHAGVEFALMHRTPEYYAETLQENIKIAGGLWDVAQSHTVGFSRQLNDLCGGVITSGYYFDTILKGWSLDKKNLKRPFFLPRKSVLAPPGNLWNAWDLIKLNNPKLEREVEERIEKKYSGINLRNPSESERLKLEINIFQPTSQMPGICEITVPYRTLAFDPLCADNGLIDLACRIPPALKINSAVIIEAIRRIDPEALKVVNANTGASINASLPVYFIQSMSFAVSKKIRKKRGIPEGSWISWSNYIRTSDLIKQYWFENRRGCEELITEVTGRNPFDTPFHKWSRKRTEMKFFRRALFLVLWDRYRIKRGDQ